MRYINSYRPVQVPYVATQSLGVLPASAGSISSSTWWLLGAVGLGLYLFGSKK